MIFITSDSHFYHKNICKGESSWDNTSRCRDFQTVIQMNACVVENINNAVKESDTLYHLGDFCFGGVDHYSIRNGIKCKDIHYICGNHSNNHGKEYDPIMSCGNRVSSLFSSYGYYKELTVRKTKIVLFHYPIQSWNHMNHGGLMLHGHCHRSPEEKYANGGRSMDVGLDGNDLKPYLLDDVLDDLLARPISREGHHG